MAAPPHPYWPLFDLRVVTPMLTLRYIDDEVGAELAKLMNRPIHEPATMPFGIPWTDVEPPDRQREAFRFWWRCRATTTAAAWNLTFAIAVDGRAVGACDMHTSDFPTLRSFGTGSWIGMDHQGRGYGKEMRAAMLHLGFAGFGALEATTSAFADNGPSLGVTRHLGYEPNGTERRLRRAAAGDISRFRMSRERWETIRRDDIEIVGLAPVTELLAITTE